MSSYCDESDLYDFGLARGALTNPGRLVNSVDTTADTLKLDSHGFSTDVRVSFRAEALGTLPSPLAKDTDYFAIPVTGSTFSVAATAGGAAITLTTAGSNIVVITDIPVAAAIEWASGILDDMLPAHVVPLTAPFPDIIIATCAELAAGKLLSRTGSASESLATVIDNAMKRVARWGRGVPLRGTNAPTSRTNKSASAVVPYKDTRGWGEFGGI